MPMTGTDVRATREALLDAYSEDDLRILLREVMDVKFDRVVGSGDLPPDWQRLSTDLNCE